MVTEEEFEEDGLQCDIDPGSLPLTPPPSERDGLSCTPYIPPQSKSSQNKPPRSKPTQVEKLNDAIINT